MRVVLCDDNAKEREYFSKLVKDLATKNSIFIELDIFEDASELLFKLEDELEKIDIFLLDINMPKMNGMELASRLRSRGFSGELVFLTVSKEYILEAFDVRAFNYIVKGETSTEKTKSILLDVLKLGKEKSEEYILFTGIGEYRNIAISSIKYFEVKGKIVTVYYGIDKSFEFISTIAKLENLLYAKNFIRIHRSFLVSSLAIANHSFKEVVLADGTCIPLGRKYYTDLKRILASALITLMLVSNFFVSKSTYANESRYRISIEKRPTENETGLRKYVNEENGEVHYEVIEATGHIWSEWQVEKEATQDKEGLMYRVCTKYPDSPHYEYMTIPALSESITNEVSIDKLTPNTNATGIANTTTLDTIADKTGTSNIKNVTKKPIKEKVENIQKTDEPSSINTDKEIEETIKSTEDNLVQIAKDLSTNKVVGSIKLYNSALVLAADIAILSFTFGFIFWIIVILVPMIMALFWIRRKKKELEDKKI